MVEEFFQEQDESQILHRRRRKASGRHWDSEDPEHQPREQELRGRLGYCAPVSRKGIRGKKLRNGTRVSVQPHEYAYRLFASDRYQ